MTWALWEESDRNIVVAHWKERDISVVFPLPWVLKTCWPTRTMLDTAKARVKFVEDSSGQQLAAGSVLLAFSKHVEQPEDRIVNSEALASI